MQTTKWLAAAIAAGWMGAAAAQGGGGGGVGGGKDTSGTAGTDTSSRTDMQTGTGIGPRDPGTPVGEERQLQQSAEQAGSAAAASATGAMDETATLAKMHAGNEAEVNAGQWMKQHATNSKVKGFAKKMVEDHGKLDKDANKFAQKHDLQLASAPEYTEAKAKHEAALEQMKTMQGAQLDRHYMQMMVEDHTKDVSHAKAAVEQAKQGKDKEYTKLLEHAAKTMEGHLKDAQKISKDLTSRQARQPTGQ